MGARATVWCLLTHAESSLPRGGEGESLVPLYTPGSVLSLLTKRLRFCTGPFWWALNVIIPVVTTMVNDSKKEVSEAARACLGTICGSIDNRDVEPFIPALVSATIDHEAGGLLTTSTPPTLIFPLLHSIDVEDPPPSSTRLYERGVVENQHSTDVESPPLSSARLYERGVIESAALDRR